MYKVTLSMPIYNVEKSVERALNSALNQTFESIEYILVDDKGSDKSRDIVDTIIKNHPRRKDVRIIEHTVNIGLGGVRNTAITNAQGAFIYFMDSDDEITPDCISILYEKMMETPVDFVEASHKYKPLDKESHFFYSDLIYPNKLVTCSEHAVAKAFYLEKIRIYTTVWNKLYNMDFLKRNSIKCIPHHLNEDAFFTYQIILQAQSCRLVSDVTYIYYETSNSIVKISVGSKSISLKIAKAFEEIVALQTSYAQNYTNVVFYSELIRRNYAVAKNLAMQVYNSKAIVSKEKIAITQKMLKYPITWKEMRKMNYKVKMTLKICHYIYYFINKLPIVSLKIFLYRTLTAINNERK
jgi:glycosyltransferase involved in cell wall biosynthesis